MKYIVTADDFGMSENTNKAIIEGVKKGIISSTNVMVNMPYANAILELKKKHKEVFIGIHFNLTTGQPISLKEDIPSLVNEHGEFYNIKEFRNRIRKGKINKSDIFTEAKAQIDLYVEKYGIPDYWNTHNHIQMLPGVLKLLDNLCSDYGVIYARFNYKVLSNRKNILNCLKNIRIRQIYFNALKSSLKFTMGLVCYENNDEKLCDSTYRQLAAKKKNEVSEIMLHVSKTVDSPFFGKLTEQRVIEYKYFICGGFYDLVKNGEVTIFYKGDSINYQI